MAYFSVVVRKISKKYFSVNCPAVTSAEHKICQSFDMQHYAPQIKRKFLFEQSGKKNLQFTKYATNTSTKLHKRFKRRYHT